LTSAALPPISLGQRRSRGIGIRPIAASAADSCRHARLIGIGLKRVQDLPQQLRSTLHGFIAAKARNFEMLILKYVDLNSFPDQSNIQSKRVRSCPFDIEM
jgi:hypothetical protein